LKNKTISFVILINLFLFGNYCQPPKAREPAFIEIQHSDQTETRLKVITFNTYLLCLGPGCILHEVPDVKKRLKQITAWLKRQNADIIFLQEVWQPEYFEYIRHNSGFPYSIYFGEETELAILSRYKPGKLVLHEKNWIGSYVDTCKLRLLGYNFGGGYIPINVNGRQVILYHMHLAPPRYPHLKGFSSYEDQLTPERLINVIERRDFIDKFLSKKPVIFAGDFNINFKSRAYDLFKRIFPMKNPLEIFYKNILEDEKTCSFCGFNKLNIQSNQPSEGVLDHIFVNSFFKIKNAEIHFPESDLSDHQPVSADLTLKKVDKLNIKKNDSFKELISVDEIKALKLYIENVTLSNYCYLNIKTGFMQRTQTIEYLNKFFK